jgi:tRNA A-37 threonylcarbamoyl transferase component Bud32
MTVNGIEFNIVKLLGKGKGGYSYLAERDGQKFVLKQIHHEPCDYYTFGDKLASELRDYETLSRVGINMPKLLDVDVENERILKEFIDGETIMSLVERGVDCSEYIEQVKKMCALLYPAGLNIDYYPTNFIPQDNVLYYIDYECNVYSDEWNFENWGIKYWSKTKEFLEYMQNHS